MIDKHDHIILLKYVIMITDSASETALHLAASSGCHELVTLLVRAGSAVDAEDENLSTPAMLAALGGHPHCVHELVVAHLFAIWT